MTALAARTRWSEGRIRLGLLGLCLALAWIGMGVRLYQVQVLDASQLAEAGVGQRRTEEVLLPQRGNIFDRNGDPMAMTVDSQSIYLRPAEITEPLYVAQQVGGLLGVPSDGLLESINAGDQFVYVKRQVELAQAEQVLSLNLSGVHSHEEPKRVYPTGSVASHVVGFVNIDGVGSEGI